MRTHFDLSSLGPCPLSLEFLGAGVLISTLLGCSPQAAPIPGEASGFGGAVFVVWPLPEEGSAAPGIENPWLSGDALAEGASGSGGQPTSGEPSLPAAGGSAPESTDLPSSGGTISAETPESAEPDPPALPAQLRFRAYLESTNAFKALVIEHIGGDPARGCAVELYSNGSSEIWRSLALPEGILEGDRVTLCVAADAAVCSAEVGGSAYNGNDALVLRCEGRVEDVFGVVGVDPGKGWSGAGYDGAPVTTVDQGLWRCGNSPTSLRPSFDLGEWLAWDWETDPSWQGPPCGEAGWGGAGG